MSLADRARRISPAGVKKRSRPGHTSLTIGVPQAAASNSRTLGENPALHHVLAGDVQRVAQPVVKPAMLGGLEMNDPFHVVRPLDASRVLRTGDDEPAVRPVARGAQHQLLEHRLAILAVGPEIPQVVVPRRP